MKKDRDKVENMAHTKQAVHKKTTERIGLSQKFKIEYDTVENVDRNGNELFANWKCLIQEKEEAIQTASTKLQNMQPSKLSENRLRQEIEQWIDFKEADRHVMKRRMHNLQTSMKDKLHYLRKQKHFLLDKQKTLKNVYKTIEKSNRSRIPNPFLQFILDVKREHYQLFNEELLISSNGSLNKYKRQMIEANTAIIDDTTLYFGRTGKTNVMTQIHENKLESDKCITGECVDSCCACRRSESELSFLNHEFEIECNMFELSIESKKTENGSRKKDTQRTELQKHAKRSTIPVQVKLPPLLANKKIKYEEKSSSTPVKLPLLLLNKKMKYVEDSYSESLKRQPLLPNKNMLYAKECSDTTLKLPALLPDKEKTCMQQHPFTYRPGTPKLLPPLQILPQNIKKTLIVNKIRDENKDKSKVNMSTESTSKPATQQLAETNSSNEILDMSAEMGSKRISNEKKEKSRVIPTQSKSITANGGTLNMNSEFALRRVKWENKFPTFRLQKASGKDYHISERKYRFSRLHKSSGKNCYIPKSKSDKVSKIVTKKYCTTRTQKRNVKKQTEMERPDRYPAPDQIHNWQDNLKNILILKKMRNEKKCESEVVKSMPLSATQKADETKTSKKKSKPTQEQADATKAANKISKSAQEQTDETKASHKMSRSVPEQTDKTTYSNKMSKSTQQQADRTTTSNQMSELQTAD
ncbi:unnamed protein product [Mytilus edulis]|uniref:Uncharacterized protein n=1 Tax=Mytilus edulis TaxID=6550 RepID=A0A8S3PN42_MYTED|nr:unnamed protein product [Mytilus edulis]